MATHPLTELFDLQAGLVSRHQVLALSGESDATIRRRLRRREWSQVHPGVYVNHTGPLSWLQRAWAAVLTAAPAALSHESALRAADGPGRRGTTDTAPIHVAIDRNRAIRVPDDIVLHRISGFDAKVLSNLSPPRVRIEEAVLDLASALDGLDAVAVLTDAVRSRRTTAAKLQAALVRRTRIRGREFLAAVLADINAGTCSVLEREYLDRVERAHRLPAARRQVKESAKGTLYRDVDYEEFALIVELDGRAFHSGSRARDRDLERDLDAALTERETIRLGWGQVHDRACSTAAKLAAFLSRRGWRGTFRCCPSCPQQHSGDLQSPGDWDSPLSA